MGQGGERGRRGVEREEIGEKGKVGEEKGGEGGGCGSAGHPDRQAGWHARAGGGPGLVAERAVDALGDAVDVHSGAALHDAARRHGCVRGCLCGRGRWADADGGGGGGRERRKTGQAGGVPCAQAWSATRHARLRMCAQAHRLGRRRLDAGG